MTTEQKAPLRQRFRQRVTAVLGRMAPADTESDHEPMSRSKKVTLVGVSVAALIVWAVVLVWIIS